MNLSELKDPILISAINIIDQLDGQRMVQSAVAFKAALLTHLKMVPKSEERNIAEVLLNSVGTTVMKKAKLNAFRMSPVADGDCTTGDCNEDVIEEVAIDVTLPVEEDVSSKSVSAVLTPLTDDAMVKKFNDITKYQNANQVYLHFGGNVDEAMIVNGALKSFVKTTMSSGFYNKVKATPKAKNEVLAEKIFDQLLAVGIIQMK